MARCASVGLIMLAAFAAGCRENRTPIGLLPENGAGGWHRTSLREVTVSEAPDPVPRSEVTRLETAE